MTFFHCVTAFTSFGSIPVSDAVSLWFEKLQVYTVNLQSFQVSRSLFCEALKNSRSAIDSSKYKLNCGLYKSICNLAATKDQVHHLTISWKHLHCELWWSLASADMKHQIHQQNNNPPYIKVTKICGIMTLFYVRAPWIERSFSGLSCKCTVKLFCKWHKACLYTKKPYYEPVHIYT